MPEKASRHFTGGPPGTLQPDILVNDQNLAHLGSEIRIAPLQITSV